MTKVAVTYSPEVGGSSVISLKASFVHVGSEVIDGDYRKMMEDIPKEKFDQLYLTHEGREVLFAHAKAKAMELLKDVDVLALSGNSAMIDPELFNQTRDKDRGYDLSRTIAELALVHVATEKGMPIFGVCGGHQVVAVYGGGEILDLNSHKLGKQKFMNYDLIKLNKDSMIGQIIAGYSKGAGKNVAEGEYYEREFFGAHEQAVSKLGAGFKQTGTASDSESIEAVESEFGVPIITTQFHPEVGAKGLPNGPFFFKSTPAAQEMNLNVFRYLHKAGQAYSEKKRVMAELSQNGMQVKKGQPKQSQHVSEKRENEASSKQENFLFLGTMFSVIGSAIRTTYHFVKEKFYKILRGTTSKAITAKKVSSLKAKEIERSSSEGSAVKKEEAVIPSSSFSSTLHNTKVKAPSEIFRETPAQLWTKQDDVFEKDMEDDPETKSMQPRR